MKKSMVAVIFLILVVMSMAMSSKIWGAAGFGFQGDDPLAVLADDENAPGTKLYATIAVYYVPGYPFGALSDMTFFIRLSKGGTLYGFSGPESWCENKDPAIPIDPLNPQIGSICPPQVQYTSLEEQKIIIKAYIARVVIPQLYHCGPRFGGATCPNFVVKSVTDGVSAVTGFYDRYGIKENCPDCADKFFALWDGVIAVQE